MKSDNMLDLPGQHPIIYYRNLLFVGLKQEQQDYVIFKKVEFYS